MVFAMHTVHFQMSLCSQRWYFVFQLQFPFLTIRNKGRTACSFTFKNVSLKWYASTFAYIRIGQSYPPGDARKYRQFKVIMCLALRHQLLVRKLGKCWFNNTCSQLESWTFPKSPNELKAYLVKRSRKTPRGSRSPKQAWKHGNYFAAADRAYYYFPLDWGLLFVCLELLKQCLFTLIPWLKKKSKIF